MRKSDNAKFEALAKKIASGECRPHNILQFVTPDFLCRNKTYINRLFEYHQDKLFYEIGLREGFIGNGKIRN